MTPKTTPAELLASKGALFARLKKSPDELELWAEYGEVLRQLKDSRAEAIALDVRIGRASSFDERHKHRRRLGAVIEKHEKEWVGCNLADEMALGNLLCEFRYGHLVGVTFFEKPAFHQEPLNALWILDNEETFPFFHKFSYLPVKASYLRRFLRITHLKRLKFLDICMYGLGVEEAKLIARSPHLSNLEHLRLSAGDIGAAGLKDIVKSSHLTRLKRLDIPGRSHRRAARSAAKKSYNRVNVRWDEDCTSSTL